MVKSRAGIFGKINRRLKPSYGGMVGGLIFFCLSFTPSLLPRGYVLQGIASALSFASGYGIAVAIAHLYHALPKKFRRTLPAAAKKAIIVVLLVLSLIFMLLGFKWQDEVRTITQAPAASNDYLLRVLVVAAGLAILIIWASRGIRHFGRYFGKILGKYIPRKLAVYGGGILAAIVLVLLINGVLIKGLFGAINYTFGLANQGTPAGIYQPQDGLYSGSPSSAIDWNSLGEKGREFVATAPSQADIAKFSGQANAHQPSRLYVGLESAPSLQERVNLLIKELDRTRASHRAAVLIAIPTGSGGVNAKSVQSVEYLYGGDTATMAIQYSYLPSWLSFLADQDTARENGRVLVDAVYNWWSHLDPAHRPKLLMYGESLGTFGADGAFSSASDMHARMNGVLLAGPPYANQLWSDIVASRDDGSRQVLPIYQNGEVVRFSDGTDNFSLPQHQPWLNNRVGIIQHASDPVVWAGLPLFLRKPDWLREPRGNDVLPNMRWYPLVTGWQVALDLPFAFGATPGHGHRYGNSLASSWTAVLDMKLSADKANQLNQIIDQVKG